MRGRARFLAHGPGPRGRGRLLVIYSCPAGPPARTRSLTHGVAVPPEQLKAVPCVIELGPRLSALLLSEERKEPVEIFQFDRGERIVQSYGSRGLSATRVAAGTGQVRLTCLTVAPGGLIGTHPATDAQLFLVIAGQGWAAGPDGERVPISAGWGVRWAAGETHTSGTEAGLIALAVEGSPLDLFEPE